MVDSCISCGLVGVHGCVLLEFCRIMVGRIIWVSFSTNCPATNPDNTADCDQPEPPCGEGVVGFIGGSSRWSGCFFGFFRPIGGGFFGVGDEGVDRLSMALVSRRGVVLVFKKRLNAAK